MTPTLTQRGTVMCFEEGQDIELRSGTKARITRIDDDGILHFVYDGGIGTYDCKQYLLRLGHGLAVTSNYPFIIKHDKCGQETRLVPILKTKLHDFMLHDKIDMPEFGPCQITIVTDKIITFVCKNEDKTYCYNFETSKVYELHSAHRHEFTILKPTLLNPLLYKQKSTEHLDWNKDKQKMEDYIENASKTSVSDYDPAEIDLGLIERTDVDSEIYLKQTEATDFNPVLKFGPLSAKLSELITDGFHLEVLGYKGQDRRETMYLTRKGERYKICRKPMSDFLKCKDLTELVRTQNLTHKLNIEVEYTLMPRKIVYRDVYKEMSPERLWDKYPELFEITSEQAWEVLKKEHPVKAKKEMMIGNRTLKEFVADTLMGMVQ